MMQSLVLDYIRLVPLIPYLVSKEDSPPKSDNIISSQHLFYFFIFLFYIQDVSENMTN